MKIRSRDRVIVFGIILFLITCPIVFAADIAADVETLLREIRQDQPVPAVNYLKITTPVNIDCTYYRGQYKNIGISVETHPKSDRIASILLKIPGPDRTKEMLPAVQRVIGPAHYSEPKTSQYGWEWSDYRTASVHYAAGAKPGEGLTIVSFFYR